MNLKKKDQYFLGAFKRQPLVLTRAKGPYVWDQNGRRYLDFFSGLAVCGVGHNQPQVVRSATNQLKKLIHVSNFFYTVPQSELAKALAHRYPGAKVFFGNSGTEANELAIKLARLWANHHQKPGREIITFSNSFHGRTLAAATATSQIKNKVFSPLPGGFRQVPYNNAAALKKAVGNKTIAILLELVQGEGGIHVAQKDFVQTIRQLCRKQNLLLMVDEVQSGMGRTGTFFAFEQFGLKPDVVTLAKGLAGGLPLSATLVRPNVAKWLVPGLHGSTFGGNPVSCAASLEVLKILSPARLRAIRNSATWFHQRLESFKSYSNVVEIRKMGLMVGLQLKGPGQSYVDAAREKGLLINCTQTDVLRFLPPYFLTRATMNQGFSILDAVFKKLAKEK